MPTLASAFEGLRNGVLENLALSDNGLHRLVSYKLNGHVHSLSKSVISNP